MPKFLILALFSISQTLDIVCNWKKCNQITIGDGLCNLECMTPSCSFDAVFPDLAQGPLPGESDCFEACLERNCTSLLLGNGVCDDICNNVYCGYDFGDCSYCGSLCQQDQLGGYCDFECNVPECYYDANSCKECSPGCITEIWGNGICNPECDNSLCNFDNGDCLNSTCAPNCQTWMIGNSICDEACNVKECEYDKSDCYCAPNCFEWMIGNGVCDEVCNDLQCDFDDGDCGYCASGCSLKMLANDVCDPACNTKEFEWDYYACGCADGCTNEDYGKCKPECLVGSCNYDRMSSDPNLWCYDENLIKFTIYQQMIQNDTSYVVSAEKCYSASNYQCTLSKAVDPYKCYQECYIPERNYGSCNSTNYWGCINYFPVNAWNICEFCTDIDRSFGEFCNQCYNTDSSCKTLSLFGISLSYINETSLLTKFRHLSFYYATSIQNSNLPEDGSYFYPFQSLNNAFISMSTENNVLYLFNDGNYIMENRPIDRNLKIASFDGSKVIIKNSFWSSKWILPVIFELENLIFDGRDDDYFYFCQNPIYCFYCPYLTYNINDGNYYSDRNELINRTFHIQFCFNEQNDLQNVGSFPLIYEFNSCSTMTKCINTIKISNTKFMNFKHGVSSIFSTAKSLKLYNVILIIYTSIHLKNQASSKLFLMRQSSPNLFI